MLKYPLSTLLYLAKINIKDTIQDALKLHNNIDIRVEAKVIDKNGKIIKVHKQKSHSFLMNFLAILATTMINSFNSFNNYYYFRITSGTWYSLNASNTGINSLFTMLDGANDSSYGIVVGTGTATPTPNDYALRNQIVNGTGSGELVYSAHSVSPSPGTSELQAGTSTPSVGVLNVSGNTTSLQISRQFTNQSGASITVSEVGIISESLVTSTLVTNELIIHDLLSSPVTVPNLSILQITYTISVTT